MMTASAFDRIPVLRAARSAAGSLLLGLDFDGTLARIVPRPEDAEMIPAARDALESIAHRTDTHIAIVSGRSLADLRTRIALDNVFYAGNHGLEIEGPGVHRVHAEADAARDLIADLASRLESELGGIAGVEVEDKGLTLSVHSRRVESEDVERDVNSRVHAVAADVKGVRLTDGKKVVEVRPDVDWHKGRAFVFLRATLEAQFGAGPAVFIGDDRTDEDVFRGLAETDCAVIVGDPPSHRSVARAALRTPDEVAEFIHLLARDDDA